MVITCVYTSQLDFQDISGSMLQSFITLVYRCVGLRQYGEMLAGQRAPASQGVCWSLCHRPGCGTQ